MIKAINVFTKTFNDIFLNLKYIFIISIIWGVTVLPCIFLLPLSLGIIVILFVSMPILSGVVYSSKGLLEKNEFKISSIFYATKKYYFRSIKFFLIFFLFVFIVGASWWYYIKVGQIIYLMVAIIQSWFAFLFFTSQVYTLPILVFEDTKVIEAIKKSVEKFMNNPKYSIKIFLQIFLLIIIAFISGIFIPLLFAGVFGILCYNINYAINKQKEEIKKC